MKTFLTEVSTAKATIIVINNRTEHDARVVNVSSLQDVFPDESDDAFSSGVLP
jgi:hypothetical protein